MEMLLLLREEISAAVSQLVKRFDFLKNCNMRHDFFVTKIKILATSEGLLNFQDTIGCWQVCPTLPFPAYRRPCPVWLLWVYKQISVGYK